METKIYHIVIEAEDPDSIVEKIRDEISKNYYDWDFDEIKIIK